MQRTLKLFYWQFYSSSSQLGLLITCSEVGRKSHVSPHRGSV